MTDDLVGKLDAKGEAEDYALAAKRLSLQIEREKKIDASKPVQPDLAICKFCKKPYPLSFKEVYDNTCCRCKEKELEHKLEYNKMKFLTGLLPTVVVLFLLNFLLQLSNSQISALFLELINVILPTCIVYLVTFQNHKATQGYEFKRLSRWGNRLIYILKLCLVAFAFSQLSYVAYLPPVTLFCVSVVYFGYNIIRIRGKLFKLTPFKDLSITFNADMERYEAAMVEYNKKIMENADTHLNNATTKKMERKLPSSKRAVDKIVVEDVDESAFMSDGNQLSYLAIDNDFYDKPLIEVKKPRKKKKDDIIDT